MPDALRSAIADSEQQARTTLDEDIHYLTAVAQMADVKEVLTHEPIFTANGIKLIDKDIAIDGGLRERLINHRLLKPIDQSLLVKNGVSGTQLAEEAARLMIARPYLQSLLTGAHEEQASREALRQLKLPAQLAFKLTVARTRLPWLFEHLLMSALISHFLAQRLKLSEQQCATTLLACLLHDLGELHTDPSVVDRRHPLSEGELCYIDVHPVIGYLIAREIVPEHPDVATAVLQHHEKLDGSGYPHRLKGAAIVPLARIIAVADASASIIARFPGDEHLRTWMRLNRHKFDSTLIGLLHRGMQRNDAARPGDEPLNRVQIEAAAQLLERWDAFALQFPQNPPPEIDFLFERMADLRFMLLQFGLDPADPLSLQTLIDDREIAQELAAAFDEVRRQTTDILRETLRRRESIDKALPLTDGVLLDVWLDEIRSYLQRATPEGRIPAPERRGSRTAS